MVTFERTEVDFAPGWMVVGAMQGKTAPFDKFWDVPNLVPEPCRDHFEIEIANQPHDNLIRFAVADGISSEPNSDLGARHAVKAAMIGLDEVCREGFPEKSAFERLFGGVHEYLVSNAEKWRCSVESLGTTLLVGVFDRRNGYLACASVGDAFVVADSGNSVENLWWFPSTQNFEPTGATYSVTDRNWKRVLTYQPCPFPIATVIAFTDGLLHVMFEVDRSDPNRVTRNPHRKAVTAIRTAVLQHGNVSRSRNLATLLGMRENKKLMEDDRTLIVIQRLDGLGVMPRKDFPGAVATKAPEIVDALQEPVSDYLPSESIENATPLVPVANVSPEELRHGLNTLASGNIAIQGELKLYQQLLDRKLIEFFALAIAILLVAQSPQIISAWTGLVSHLFGGGSTGISSPVVPAPSAENGPPMSATPSVPTVPSNTAIPPSNSRSNKIEHPIAGPEHLAPTPDKVVPPAPSPAATPPRSAILPTAAPPNAPVPSAAPPVEAPTSPTGSPNSLNRPLTD